MSCDRTCSGPCCRVVMATCAQCGEAGEVAGMVGELCPRCELREAEVEWDAAPEEDESRDEQMRARIETAERRARWW